MQDEFKLSSVNSSRVTYAAVFLLSADNPDQEIKYLLPEGMRGANGFETYNKFKHHRDKGNGTLCCGNCFEHGKEVPVYHRGETDERVGGGDKQGTHATWSAYPNTVDDHHDKCKERRTSSGRTEQSQMIRWSINIPETYATATPPHSISAADPLIAKRKSKPIHQWMQELIGPVGRLTRQQAQEAVYVVGGRATLHKNMMIDGDNWKSMVKGDRRSLKDDNLYKLFHVSLPTSGNIRDFADAASDKHGVTKIKCAEYSFIDEKGRTHYVQPVIHTSRDDVRAVFEKSGDYLVLAPFAHDVLKDKKTKVVHEIKIYVGIPQLVAELYRNPARKISDYNAIHNLQMSMNEVQLVEPKTRMTFPKIPVAHPGQVDMFAAELSLPDQRPH